MSQMNTPRSLTEVCLGTLCITKIFIAVIHTVTENFWKLTRRTFNIKFDAGLQTSSVARDLYWLQCIQLLGLLIPLSTVDMRDKTCNSKIFFFLFLYFFNVILKDPPNHPSPVLWNPFIPSLALALTPSLIHSLYVKSLPTSHTRKSSSPSCHLSATGCHREQRHYQVAPPWCQLATSRDNDAKKELNLRDI